MEKKWPILNFASVLLVIAVNYVSQSMRLNNTTIGEMSDKYNNLFTPASYAFAIWGLIFLGLLAFGIFQVYRVNLKKAELAFVKQTGPWFAFANFLNAGWVIAFSFDYVGLSLLIMFGILYSLLKIVVNTNMERWDAPIEIIAFCWWPICLYSGWITVATIANISIYLTKIGWSGWGITDATWTIIAIIAVVLINLLIIYKRNMREFAAVGIWALVAIYIRHNDTYEAIAITALVGSIVIGLYAAYHGYKNRHTNPGFKLMQRLKG